MHGFRNYREPFAAAFEQRITAIVGLNGRGKTNLIEAIYLLCRLRGFRDESPGRLRTWDTPSGVVAGVFSDFDREVVIGSNGLALKQDGDRVQDRRSWVRQTPIFGYRPDDDLFFHVEPEQRRRYLDWLAAMCFADYIPTAAAYRRALQQRNAALRQRLSRVEREVWDAQLVEAGYRIHCARKAAAAHLGPVYAQLWEALERPPAEVVYRSNLPETAEAYADALREAETADLERGWTSIGVHRDDLVVYREGRPVRQSASQGYRKLTIILLSLACALCLPGAMFYIDDLEGELDDENESRLFSLLLGSRTRHLQMFFSAVRTPDVLSRHDAGPDINWIRLA